MASVMENVPPNVFSVKTIGNKKVRVPPKVSIADITPNNVGTVKRLNSVLFPVAYSDKFYKDATSPEQEPFSKLLYYQDLAVGNVIGRIETKEDGETVLYIMTLGILAPYRHQGLATRLLDHVKHAVQKHNEPAAQQNGTSAAASARPPPPGISKMYLHVQVTNESGKAFWEKRGFQVKETIKGYYKKIEPSDAWLLECQV